MPHFAHFTILTLIFINFTSGCAHSPLPFVPKELEKIPGGEKVKECGSDISCLQIFILYGSMGCSHAAIRLQVTENDTVFWDPAGGYGIAGSVRATRVKDLVIKPVPTVNEYLQFRTEVPTEAAEIFEFWLERSDAEYLLSVLRQNSEKGNADILFDTQGVGLFCSYHISEFLEKFAGRVIIVKQAFLPHNLAQQLYGENPDRVLVVRFRGKGYDISIAKNPVD